MTLDVLASPALVLFLDLERRGCRFRLDGAEIVIQPGGVLTREERAALQNHYENARLLVTLASDEGVHARRDVFRQQLEAAPLNRMPALLFRRVPYVRGHCFSCGNALDTVRFGRCWRCSLAWRLACRLPIPTSAYDHARLI